MTKGCLDINTFKWADNCCYIDSVIIALLITNSEFVSDSILNSTLTSRDKSIFSKELKIRQDIQKQLKNIHSIMFDNVKHNINCNMLRKYLKFYPTDDTFHKTDLNDASDFLQYIMDIFDTKLATVKKITYTTKNVISAMPRNKDIIDASLMKESVIFESNKLPDLDRTKSYQIKKFLKTYEDNLIEEFQPNNDNGYERIIVEKELIDAPFIVFRINRYFDDDIFYKTKVIPTKTLSLNNKSFFLCGIVIFKNVHYTCYFLCIQDRRWYYYNDGSEKKISYIGNYSDMLKSKPSPLSNGVLYFYNLS